MAEKEMYDYLGAVSADVDVTLSVAPQRIVTEDGNVSAVIHEGDDASEERVALSTTPVFYVLLEWSLLTATNAGTIYDIYFSSSYGCGTTKSFKWSHPTDGHTYVVRFADPLSRNIRGGSVHGVAPIRLKVLGRINDA